MTNKLNPESIFEARPAAQPGAHAPAGFISDEYDEKIVNDQISHLEALERMSLKELEAYKLKELKILLVEAGLHVPYWRNLFKELNFDPKAISSIRDLEKLPLLDKNKIKENYSEFISDKANLDEITYMTTGGSTGSPLKILMNKETRSKSHAATRYYLKKAGITPGLERGVRLHGNKIPKEYIDLEKFWIQEGNRLTMSVSHITMDNCSLYMEAIKDFRPNYIHAYASALALLCKYAEKNNEKFPSSIENIFCDSETVYGWQRDLIIKLTGAQFYNIYGHTEAAGMAITFPESAQLESLPVGIMEILDSNLNNLSKEKDEGQIVVTGFHNKIMPFIRYKTSDIAELGSSKKIEERFFTPILSNVKGRIQDYLVGFDESIVPAAPLLFDYNFDWTGIDLFQVYQFKKGKLEFKIVKNKSIDSNEAILEQRLIDSFSSIFGEQFSVEVSFHDELLVTKRGKYRYVDQKLEIEI